VKTTLLRDAALLVIPIILSFACLGQSADPPSSTQNVPSQQSQNPGAQPARSGAQSQQSTPPSELPNAPSSTQKEPSLGDLGFPTSQTQSNPHEQALLDRRSHMLKIHQKMGLITAVPLLATVIAGAGAGGKSTSSSTRDLHAALGGTTAVLYFTTASFAIFAPKIKGTETRGPIRVHKALAWIHGPGMILTPILGEMAFNEKSKGERVHGIASAHGPVAIVTAGAYGAAMLAVSVKF
jgi:hypothetical protein